MGGVPHQFLPQRSQEVARREEGLHQGDGGVAGELTVGGPLHSGPSNNSPWPTQEGGGRRIEIDVKGCPPWHEAQNTMLHIESYIERIQYIV